ncbi:hypothetical protein TKK_0019440 [Trichogramma kaykai]
MVGHYKKKNTKRTWSDESMYRAVELVMQGTSVSVAAKEFGIPRSTLQIKFNEAQVKNNIDAALEVKPYGYRRTFTADQGIALSNYIQNMETKLHGLASRDVMKLAFDFAVKLSIPHRFNTNTSNWHNIETCSHTNTNTTFGMAGRDWLNSFMERHGLSLRKGEHTSAARAHGFNKVAVGKFFDILKKLDDDYKFPPENIYNIDETGISVVPKSSSRIVVRTLARFS